MTLENLLAIHKLQSFEASAAGAQRLLAAAGRNLADAGIAALSSENRFDAAYKAIMQCAMIGLWANWLSHFYQPARPSSNCLAGLAQDAWAGAGCGDRAGRLAQATQLERLRGRSRQR